ncbi:RING finger protein 10 [Taenia crassiceps]|uniref:E3 ubiquitin-protein ligase RNF10 n=1 Tax=Taenia crassiceps TaxID=6207 RepID=A0ABR4Q1I0_9CEST
MKACSSTAAENELVDVSWSDVIKVEMHCQAPPLCSGCCQRPFLPRIGPCGHIYCFLCIWIRIAFDHDERVETCPACGRTLKITDLKRVSTFQSYVPKVGDRMRFLFMRKDRKVVNSYVVDIWTEKFHTHLVKAKRRNFLHLIRKDIASMKKFLSERENAGGQSVTTMVAKDILCDLQRDRERFFKDEKAKFGCFSQKYYLQLHSYDIFLHAFNRTCLLSEYGESRLPNKVTGKVVAVERFTMDWSMREAIQPLRHLAPGRIFYFVVLEFDAPMFRENEFCRSRYEAELAELSSGPMNILSAIGQFINCPLSLDIRRTNIYFADELFSLPRPDQRGSRNDNSTEVPVQQESIGWHIITLPSGSQAFFIDSLLRKYLQGDLPESK